MIHADGRDRRGGRGGKAFSDVSGWRGDGVAEVDRLVGRGVNAATKSLCPLSSPLCQRTTHTHTAGMGRLPR